MYNPNNPYYKIANDVLSGNIESLTELLKDKAITVNSPLSEFPGTTLLHLAIQEGRTEVVKLLIEHGATVNMKDEDDISPLMLAVGTANIDIVKLLLEAKGICANETSRDQTPLKLATMREQRNIIDLLTTHLTKEFYNKALEAKPEQLDSLKNEYYSLDTTQQTLCTTLLSAYCDPLDEAQKITMLENAIACDTVTGEPLHAFSLLMNEKSENTSENTNEKAAVARIKHRISVYKGTESPYMSSYNQSPKVITSVANNSLEKNAYHP